MAARGDLMHQRKEIRDLCVALIKAGATSAGQRVYPSRVLPSWKLTYPVVFVYLPSEENRIIGQRPTTSERQLRVSVMLLDANVDPAVDERLDFLASEIEKILNNDDNWGSLQISRTEYVGMESELVFEREQDKNHATMTLNFHIYYITEVEPVAAPLTAYVNVNGVWIPTSPPP
jgi:hypothetical protein